MPTFRTLIPLIAVWIGTGSIACRQPPAAPALTSVDPHVSALLRDVAWSDEWRGRSVPLATLAIPRAGSVLVVGADGAVYAADLDGRGLNRIGSVSAEEIRAWIPVQPRPRDSCAGDTFGRLHGRPDEPSVELVAAWSDRCLRETLPLAGVCRGAREKVWFRDFVGIVEAGLGTDVWNAVCTGWREPM